MTNIDLLCSFAKTFPFFWLLELGLFSLEYFTEISVFFLCGMGKERKAYIK